LHPAKHAMIFEILLRKREEIEIKFSRKNFKKFLPVRNRSCSFAPASRDTRCELKEAKNKIRHVPRHIELTAVLREILKQKNKSNRIERFEKTTSPSVK
jgi:hypothetical protein